MLARALAPANRHAPSCLIWNAQGLVALGVFFFGLLSFQANAAYVDDLIVKAREMRLHEDIGWKKILFEGRFDDPEFYRAGKKGRKDYGLELEATLRALLQNEPIVVKKGARHAQCYYPARFDYLKEKLAIDVSKIPKPECKELTQYRSFAEYTGVSVVFSSYFANNPASTFGHTLLRLHRSAKEGEPGLLDDAANFAASIDTMNPITYPVKGLMGFFPGRFALLPYSSKIQEYANFESRDLWEYELNFTPAEAHKLAISLWEAAYFYMDYFYLDENCSYMLLALLEAARPTLELTKPFRLYTIPSDTIKAVARSPGLVKSIQFKPSARGRYIERAASLTEKEREIFLDFIGRFKNKYSREELEGELARHGCDDDCKIRLYDTLLEFIDFREKKVSTKRLDLYRGLRSGVLLLRSKIPRASPAFVYRPEQSRPDRGPRSAMLEFNSGFTENGYNKSEFRWRPAHHDLTSSSLGYSDQLQIQILDFVAAYDDRFEQFYVKRWIPMELTSLGKHELALKPLSWRVEIGYAKDRNRKDEEKLYDRSQLKVAFGGARFYGNFSAYLMAQFAGGYSSDSDLFWHGGIGPRAGMFYTFSDALKFSTLFEYMRHYGPRELDRREIQSRLSYFWRVENEAYLEFRDQDFERYGGLGYRFFY